ncbi:hypothetical protein D4764_19G0000210 [Takifugu flavidus]|uniref:Uncharacterized protein n=1 Tax=Takifugu flavidus TaxID=433684 RepID=A0A5C6NLU9_9TELE|nr:hypothetical protein D4764_19G0000210 [Takifugu flavidus]
MILPSLSALSEKYSASWKYKIQNTIYGVNYLVCCDIIPYRLIKINLYVETFTDIVDCWCC